MLCRTRARTENRNGCFSVRAQQRRLWAGEIGKTFLSLLQKKVYLPIERIWQEEAAPLKGLFLIPSITALALRSCKSWG